MYFLSFCVLLLFSLYNNANAIPILSGANNVCQESDGYLPISGSCDLYILCKDFTPTNEICPDGLHFNNATKFPDTPCSYPKDVPCKDQISQKPKPVDNCLRQNGLFPLTSDGKNDCKKYYMCKEGVSTEMSCDDGLVFNPDSARCDNPETVPACAESAKEPDTSESTTTEATTTSEIETTNPTKDDAENISQPTTPVTAPTVEPTSASPDTTTSLPDTPANDTTTTDSGDITTVSPSDITESTTIDTTATSVTPDYQMIILPTVSQPDTTSSSTTTTASATTLTSSTDADVDKATTTTPTIAPTSTTDADVDTTTTSTITPTSSTEADVDTTTTTTISTITPTSSTDGDVDSTTSTTPIPSSTTSTSSSDADGETTEPSSLTTPIDNKEISSTSTTTTEASLQTDSTSLNPGTTKMPGNSPVTAVITYGSISMSDVRMSIPII